LVVGMLVLLVGMLGSWVVCCVLGLFVVFLVCCFIDFLTSLLGFCRYFFIYWLF